MNVSPFKISVALIVLGMVWTALVFDETEKTHDSVLLKQSSSFEAESEFSGTGIGYYKLYMSEFSGEGGGIFVQILDTKENVIQEQMVQTKMSVGYFDFNKEDGKHAIKITNVAENPIGIQIEFGNTNSQKMFPPGVMILLGAVALMMASYMKIRDYNIEQPEENIS